MPTRLLFIDYRVADYQALAARLSAQAQVFIVDGASDGLAQIVARLQGYTGLDAIDIISHGSPGALYLGATELVGSNLDAYAAQLSLIGGALSDSGDILLYGCSVAQGDAGLRFIDSLARRTGADIAASVNNTGSPVLGGDWQLELSTGPIEAVGVDAGAFTGLLSANTAPHLAVALVDKVVTVGVPFSYTIPEGSFVDADQEPLNFSLAMADGTALPSWLTFNAATRTLSGTPFSIERTIQLQVSAQDAAGAIATGNLGISLGLEKAWTRVMGVSGSSVIALVTDIDGSISLTGNHVIKYSLVGDIVWTATFADANLAYFEISPSIARSVDGSI